MKKSTPLMMAVMAAVLTTTLGLSAAQAQDAMMMQMQPMMMNDLALTPVKSTDKGAVTFKESVADKKDEGVMMNNSMSNDTMMDNTMMMDDMMNNSSMMATTSMAMMKKDRYEFYRPGLLNDAYRAGKKVIFFFYSPDANGIMLDAALDDHADWIPEDTMVFKVTYPTNSLIVSRYMVNTPNSLITVKRNNATNVQTITARETSPVTTIDAFLSWAKDGMMSNTMMDKEMITMVGGAQMFSTKDIVTNVMNAPNLTTLVAAVKAAGLVETLQGAGPFTVFGPDNMAFDMLPAGTVDMLLKPENKDMLAKILTYHVIAGNYTAADLMKMDGKMLTTVQGQKLTIKVDGKKVMLMSDTGNIATVTTADVFQSNGVAHVIDHVLMPQ